MPDACDVCPAGDDNLDADADGYADGRDNCPLDANPNQADFDDDGIGNVCDATATANVPGLQDWGLVGLVILLIAGVLSVVLKAQLELPTLDRPPQLRISLKSIAGPLDTIRDCL